MTPDPRSRRILRSVLALSAAVLPAFMADGLAAQQSRSKRAVTHDDYDAVPSLTSTSYSRDGKWMGYIVKPANGDGVLHIRAVDGEKAYEFERGQRVTFSNDGTRAFFKIGKSIEEERAKKLKKLHEKKEKKEGEEAEEEEEGLPPDILEALAERGVSEAQARQMIEAQGLTLSQIRGFLGLPEPKKKPSASAKGGGKDDEDKEAKALAKRLHVLDLATGKVTKIERVKGFKNPKNTSLLILHMEKPEPEKKKGAKGKGKGKGGEAKKPAKKAPGKKAAAKKPEKKAAKKEGAEKKGPEEKGAEKKGAKKKGAAKMGSKEKAGKGKAQKAKSKGAPKDPLEKKRTDGTKLVIRDLKKGKDTTIEHVRAYGLVADDRWMWYTVGTKKKTKGVKWGLFIRELSSGRNVVLLAGYSNVSGIRTDRDYDRLVFSSDRRTFGEDKDKRVRDIYMWDFSESAGRMIISDSTDGVPEGYRIQSSGIGFSRDGSVITFGIKPPKADELPKILPEDEIKLDLWHWKDGSLQTMQAKRPNRADATLTVVYHDDSQKAVVLGTLDAPRASLVTPDGSRALVSDNSPYEMRVTWDGRYSDYYLVNTIDGSRRKIITGLRGSASASPRGRYITWFDHRDYHWHALDVSTLKVRNLTEDIGVAFDREMDDRPEPHRAHGMSGWTKNDGEVLLNDEFDIWGVNPKTGAFRCITDGLGRAGSISFRLAGLDLRPDAKRNDEEDRKRNWLEGTLVLRAVNQETYAQGYYTDSVDAVGKPRKIMMVDQSIGRPARPADADRLFMTFSRFDMYPDVWTTDLKFGAKRKLTDAAGILKGMSWGKAELVSWRSDDGVDLKGYLIKPDGFDPKRKYPMMVYFYERSSQGIHRFVRPATGTSPNAAYYVSNGYLWFVPDIVYRDGYPGESCEKCVISGVQHLITKGFVDKSAIGVAGHSWGGYQTAHLITRTDIFAAAESGAPVVNMFSAYGGIRWGSGMSRQFQYEQTQSRIGGSIWEHPMRYWENSPLFHLDKARTPVIILHNDKDGAVPWYQGIEFFVAMRRLGKEAYLMNYNNEDHGLRKTQNKRDWTRRMQEFFDHHLRDHPAPKWMAQGVPYHERMAEKIPHAPSYRAAVKAGLIEKPAAVVDPTGGSAGTNGGGN